MYFFLGKTRSMKCNSNLCSVRRYVLFHISTCLKYEWCPSPPSQQHLVGQGILVIEASRSHSDTSHWVGLLWMCNQSDAETSHNTQRETSMPPAGFEHTSPASKWPQTQALDRAATEVGTKGVTFYKIKLRG